eukprot:TRINITY_DN82869_c0_g1_i1.p1 TRINITY_DN82869_c0_g1~~TRINITY_DN82869_c0_g1_i1.p1  ORF type:complete len:217 (-),score=45.80 TRINITY_DN82869_c0_g1_i1:329-937(-)
MGCAIYKAVPSRQRGEFSVHSRSHSTRQSVASARCERLAQPPPRSSAAGLIIGDTQRVPIQVEMKNKTTFPCRVVITFERHRGSTTDSSVKPGDTGLTVEETIVIPTIDCMFVFSPRKIVMVECYQGWQRACIRGPFYTSSLELKLNFVISRVATPEERAASSHRDAKPVLCLDHPIEFKVFGLELQTEHIACSTRHRGIGN